MWRSFAVITRQKGTRTIILREREGSAEGKHEKRGEETTIVWQVIGATNRLRHSSLNVLFLQYFDARTGCRDTRTKRMLW